MKPSLEYPRGRSFDPSMAVMLVCAGIVGAIGLGFVLGYDEIDLRGAIVVPAVLCFITLPFARNVEKRRGSGLTNIITLAFIAKLIGAYVRYVIEYFVYDGGDSGLYHRSGVAFATEYLDGKRSFGSLFPTSFGTRFIEELNGLVALVSGRSILASFMIFSWFGFLGLWAIVAAVRRTLPEVDIRLYAILVFFLPTSLFWSSALGKDAWMLLGIGLFATGAARLFTAQARGLIYLVAGGFATGMVRPHVTVLLLAAFAIAYTVARGRRGRALSPILTMVTIALIAAGAALASDPLQELLPKSQEGITAVLEETTDRSSQGGSEIDVERPNSPLEYPQAFFTVMFRPMPYEARSATQFLSALESLALFAAVVIWRRRIYAAIGRILTVPFLRFSVLYTLAFAFAWSSIGNLGIMARQRVQVLPFLLILICWTAYDERRSPREAVDHGLEPIDRAPV
ncbi:MAG: hypothetical protein ACKO84_10780 [Actinomycetota bacterium]